MAQILGLVNSRAKAPRAHLVYNRAKAPRVLNFGPRLQPGQRPPTWPRNWASSTAAEIPRSPASGLDSRAKAPRGPEFGPRQQPREGPTWPRFVDLADRRAKAPRGPDFGPHPRPRGGPTWPRFAASTTGAPRPHDAQNLGLALRKTSSSLLKEARPN